VIFLAFLLVVVIYLNASLLNRNYYPGFSYAPGENKSGYVENKSVNNKINSTCFQDINFDELNVNRVNLEKKEAISVNHSHEISEVQSVAVFYSTFQNTQSLNNYQSDNLGNLNQYSGNNYFHISSQSLNNYYHLINNLTLYKNKSKYSTTLNTPNDSIYTTPVLNSGISDIGSPVGLTAENNSVFRSNASDPGDPGGPPEDNPIPVPDGYNFLLILAAVYTGWRKSFGIIIT